MAMNSREYAQYRQTKIESGLLYQDFVVDCCWRLLGLAIVQFSSRAYQTTVGESLTGVEIKHDERMAQTGNLWIELAEKAVPRPGEYAKSGIRRDDNTWLYAIGNYDVIYLFAKRFLVALGEARKSDGAHTYKHLENNTQTSLGYLLPSRDAERYAAVILRPNAEKRVEKVLGDLHALGRALHEIAKAEIAGQLLLFENQP